MIVDDSNRTANKPVDPASIHEERILSILALLTDLASSMRSVAFRMDTMEHRMDDLDRDGLRALNANVRAKEDDSAEADDSDVEEEDADGELRTEPDVHDLPPSLALRCDGRVLLSTSDLDGVDLTKREMFIGIVLSEAETSDVLDRTDDAFLDVAAHVSGLLRRTCKRVTSH